VTRFGQIAEHAGAEGQHVFDEIFLGHGKGWGQGVKKRNGGLYGIISFRTSPKILSPPSREFDATLARSRQDYCRAAWKKS
jgi:hypothetical protein